MDVVAGEDRRRRQPGQAGLIHVDAMLLGPPVTGGGESDEIAHRRPACQNAAELLRQLEELAQPIDGHLFEAGSHR